MLAVISCTNIQFRANVYLGLVVLYLSTFNMYMHSTFCCYILHTFRCPTLKSLKLWHRNTTKP